MAIELTLKNLKDMKKEKEEATNFTESAVFNSKAALILAILAIIFFAACDSKNSKDMSNSMLNNSQHTVSKPINTWKAKDGSQPSDAFQLSDSEFILAHSKEDFLMLNTKSNEASIKKFGAELVKLTKSKEDFIFITYNSSNFSYALWSNNSLSLTGAKGVKMNEPADICYSVSQDKIYGRYRSLDMFMSDSTMQHFEPFLKGKQVSDFRISANGNYLAIQNKDELIEIVDLANSKVISNISCKKGKSNSLVGVTNAGAPVFFELHVAKKNKEENETNKLILYNASREKTLLQISSGWARVFANKILTLESNDKNEFEYKLYDFSKEF